MTDDFAEFLRFARTGFISGKTFRFNEPIFLDASLKFRASYCVFNFSGMFPAKGSSWITVDDGADFHMKFCTINVPHKDGIFVIQYLPGAIRVNR